MVYTRTAVKKFLFGTTQKRLLFFSHHLELDFLGSLIGFLVGHIKVWWKLPHYAYEKLELKLGKTALQVYHHSADHFQLNSPFKWRSIKTSIQDATCIKIIFFNGAFIQHDLIREKGLKCSLKLPHFQHYRTRLLNAFTLAQPWQLFSTIVYW